MSTLSVGTIKSASSAPPVFQNSSGTEKGQLVKMWINFDATNSNNIRGSFNVSSITDHATGYHQISFTNAMSNGNYAIWCQASTGNDLSFSAADEDFNVAASCRVITRTSRTSNATDFPYVGVSIIGEN